MDWQKLPEWARYIAGATLGVLLALYEKAGVRDAAFEALWQVGERTGVWIPLTG
jgi:hypothetical protein